MNFKKALQRNKDFKKYIGKLHEFLIHCHSDINYLYPSVQNSVLSRVRNRDPYEL